MKDHKITTYSFDELSETAKAKAIEDWRNDGHEFYNDDVIIDEFKQDESKNGVTIDKVYYSGFWSQGDGASCEGSIELLEFLKGWDKFKVFVDIIEQHSDIEYRCNFQQKGFYISNNFIEADIDYNYSEYYTALSDNDQKLLDRLYNELLGALQDWYNDLNAKIYRQLQKEYEFEDSDEYIAETLIANDYEFLEDGSMFNL